jgi:hypothetical protein
VVEIHDSLDFNNVHVLLSVTIVFPQCFSLLSTMGRSVGLEDVCPRAARDKAALKEQLQARAKQVPMLLFVRG